MTWVKELLREYAKGKSALEKYRASAATEDDIERINKGFFVMD